MVCVQYAERGAGLSEGTGGLRFMWDYIRPIMHGHFEAPPNIFAEDSTGKWFVWWSQILGTWRCHLIVSKANME